MSMNELYFGDNLDILPNLFSVDLIYLDPPYNSQKKFNHQTTSGHINGHTDSWKMTSQTMRYQEELSKTNLLLYEFTKTASKNLQPYLASLGVRIFHLHRLLKDTGALYLHCDPENSHYIKIMLDHIFGPSNYKGQIVWKRTSAHNGTNGFGSVQDVILFYQKSSKYQHNTVYIPHKGKLNLHEDERGFYVPTSLTGEDISNGESGKPWLTYDPAVKNRHWAIPKKLELEFGLDSTRSSIERLDALNQLNLIIHPTSGYFPSYKNYNYNDGVALSDVWDDIKKSPNDAGKYHTQKPYELLVRIIKSSSKEGDLVFDPYCGSGTTLVAAEDLKRNWIGIDIDYKRISNECETRLSHSSYKLKGDPNDVESVRGLALSGNGQEGRFDTEEWIVRKIGGSKSKNKKYGSDGGIDGYLSIEVRGNYYNIPISVKTGKVSSSMIRDLLGVVMSQHVPYGLFITLEPPTQHMIEAVARGGLSQFGGARIQILTFDDYFKRVTLPFPYTRSEPIKDQSYSRAANLFFE